MAIKGVAAGMSVVFFLFYIGIIVLGILGMWKMFQKAGKPGRASIIPFYNIYVMCEIAGRNGRQFLFLLIPLFNIYFWVRINVDIAKRFGQHRLFGWGLSFMSIIFRLIIAFDKKIVYTPELTIQKAE